jgi:hypothetical protein
MPSITVTQSSVLTPLPTEPSLVGSRACLIHIHLSTQEFFAIQVLNRRLGVTLLKHFDKTKPSRLAAIFILDDAYRAHLTKDLKGLSQIFR